MRNPNAVYPGEETLRQLYVVEQKSMAEIASLLEVTPTSVMRWLRRAGVQSRTIREGTILSGKYGVHSEAHRETLRKNAAIARSHITEESHRKQSETMKGRPAPNKGVPWTPERRAKTMATRSTPEAKEKHAASLRGEKNYNWKGGVSPNGTLDTWQWRKLRQEVYERDNWTCQECGVRCLNTKDAKAHPKRKIQCHHVVPRRYGGSDVMDNLVTLCMSCHHKLERKTAPPTESGFPS